DPGVGLGRQVARYLGRVVLEVESQVRLLRLGDVELTERLLVERLRVLVWHVVEGGADAGVVDVELELPRSWGCASQGSASCGWCGSRPPGIGSRHPGRLHL